MSEISWPEIVAHRERLVRIARRRCPTREDAEDVVHEAMLRCATFEGLDAERLGAFLTTVTVRLCADVYRDALRSQRATSRLGLDDVPAAEDTVVRVAEAVVLGDLLSALPARQRAVLVDRAEGMSVSQISSRHSLTYKAAESALSRARSAMRMAIAATLSVAGACVTFVRRRPAVVALPIATIALYGSTLHTRWDRDLVPRATPPVDMTTGGFVPVDRADPYAAGRAGMSLAAPAATVTHRTAAAPSLPRSPRHELSGADNDTLGTGASFSDDGGSDNPLPTTDYVMTCVTKGPSVMVWFTGPGSHAGFTQVCGHAAQPGGDKQ